MPSVIFHPELLFRLNTLDPQVLGIGALDASVLPIQSYTSSLEWTRPMSDWCTDMREKFLVSVQEDSKGHPTPEFPLGATESSSGPTWQVCSFLPNPASPVSLELHLQRVTHLHAILYFRVCFQETLSKKMLMRRRITMMASSTGLWESGMKQSMFTVPGVGTVQL